MNNKYNNETINKWSNTDSYKEFTIKTKNYSSNKFNEVNNEMINIFKSFSDYLKENKKIDHTDVQNMVKSLKEYISNNLYSCSNEMLLNLGSLYVTDERFKKNIDINCEGNAEYIHAAIKFFCNNN